MSNRTPGAGGTASLSDIIRTGIDGTAQANTVVLANNSGRTYVVTEVFIVAVTVAAYVSAPVINLGKTSAAFTDIVNGVTGPAAVDKSVIATVAASANVIKDGESLTLRVATAASAGTYTLTAIIRGTFV